MKIKLAYEEHEKGIADKLTELIMRLFDIFYIAKITKRDRYKPFLHTYITIKKRDKPHK